MMTPSILITGATGQLGHSLLSSPYLQSERGSELAILSTDRYQLDITEPNALEHYLEHLEGQAPPKLIINCAAYTAVDQAEQEIELAHRVNHHALAHLSQSCRRLGIMLIHISTDYVFDGTSRTPYNEHDQVHPLNVYGESKWLGEQALRSTLGDKGLIVRTSWLYANVHKCFLSTIIDRARSGQILRVVDDQIGSPTYAPHLAEALLRIAQFALVEGRFRSPLLHYSNLGVCSWYDFAATALSALQEEYRLVPIPSQDYPTPAQRPAYSVLDKKQLYELYDITPPHWSRGLIEYLDNACTTLPQQ